MALINYIKIIFNGNHQLAEVHYFSHLVTDQDASDEASENNVGIHFKDVALVTLYSPPDQDLLARSHGVLVSCTKLGEDSLCVIDVTSIKFVVAMVPHSPSGILEDRCFLVEKSGMEIARFRAENDDDDSV